MNNCRFTLFGLLLVLSSLAGADTIFSENFQSGQYSSWNLSGDGNDSANLYAGNYSLRLDGLRQASITLTTTGYTGVSLAVDLAALYLVNGDFCYADYSTNGGSSWQNLLTVANGQDNGQFLSANVTSGLDNNQQLRIRFRASTLYYNYCYADNILLQGTAIIGSTPELQISGSGQFADTELNNSVVQQFTLSNVGSASLTIGNLSSSDTAFSLSADQCSGQILAQGANCNVDVQFVPMLAQYYSGILQIPSNDPDTSISTVALSGTGIIADESCDYACLNGDGAVARSGLSYSQLTGTGSISLQNYSQYAVPGNAANPLNQFSGTLTLSIVNGTLTEQGTSLAGSYANPNRLPDFSFQFVQHGTHLIPLQRQLIATSHPSWEYLLMPGRVWQENGDNGYSRVALPFALQEVNANCTHNGVMTFLFKDDGSVSKLAYQIAQETCQYFKFNLHGKLNASYQSATISGAAAIKTAYVQEVAARLPVKPLSALATDYPQAGVVLANIASDQSASHLSAYGVYYNGVHYAGNCATRQGDYPFCGLMALPSYSTAKSVVAGFALMRLQQKYGGNQRELIISDYVSECAASRWADVSFGQTLDMATGNYNSAGASVDEGAQATIDNFFLVGSHQAKIQHACAYPRKAAPGSQFVYHSSDTYILSRAMQQYYRSMAGTSADYYTDLLVNELWQPLQLSPLTHNSKRTYDAQAQPLAGYGLSFISDDLIKLGRFAHQQQGQINGQQLLDAGMLQDAMQLGSNGGLSTGTASSRYRYGFWAYDLSDSTQVGCANPSWVPYMSGFGGIGVVMLPNQMVYYYVSDNSEYGFTKTVKELAKISPVCS